MAESRTQRESSTSGQSSQALARGQQNQRGLAASDWYSNPFELMDRMAEEMDRSFDRVFRGVGAPRRSWLGRSAYGSGARTGIWAPRVEAFQNGDQFIVRAELPGLKKDDVQVEVTDDVLTIRGERRDEREEQREGVFHSEREYGEFYRSIALPDGVIADNAKASFKDGVLEITMPAPPAETRARKLEISEGAETGGKK
jgi:HSP20 family protein